MYAESNEKSIKDGIRILACLLHGKMADGAWLESVDLKELYSFARKHSIEAVIDEALERAGVRDEAFVKAKAQNIQRSMLFDSERRKILKEFDQHGIWYVVLKGAVLQNYYPSYGLRQMTDNDVLFDRSKAEEVRDIMEGMGYETVEFGNNAHDVYHKKPVMSFEMHVCLFPEHVSKPFYEYYQGIETKLRKADGETCELRFSKEDFYLYLTAHEYKHFSDCGTGLKNLLDVYLYLTKEKLDLDYVRAEAEKMGVAEFEEKNRMLAMHLFDEEALTEKEQEFLQSFLLSGTFGNMPNKVRNKNKRYGGGKIKYVIKRLAIPVSRKNPYYVPFSNRYPVFYKHKILLPLLPFYRIYTSIREKRFMGEFDAMKEIGS